MQNNCITAVAVAIGRLDKSLPLCFFIWKIRDVYMYCLNREHDVLCACYKKK